MSRIYTVVFENVTVAAAQDLFQIAPAADKAISVHGIVLSNVGGAADAGDAQEELLRLIMIRGFATVGSGGTAGATGTNMNPLSPGDSAPSFGARTNDTTVAVVGGGTTINLFTDGWNVRIPYQMFFTPECRPVCTLTQTRLVFRLLSTPADSLSVSGTLFLEEIS